MLVQRLSLLRCRGAASFEPAVHAHPHSSPRIGSDTPLGQTPGVDLHEVASKQAPRQTLLATRTFPQTSTSRVSAALESASHKLSDSSCNPERRATQLRVLCQTRQIHHV
ncbi:hypothetical protein TgHK011_002017 [Trichoderma gracile]|nr:hypothetical protein TgHK011_002017 [Trichoderma gracile]